VVGLSLLSACVMRLHNEATNDKIELFLPNRSLYIMSNSIRYNYTHEIPPKNSQEIVLFDGKEVKRSRRISIIIRNEVDCV